MSEPVYVNKDAEYLHSLGNVYIEDDDPATGMRLQHIAAHLQSLDDRLGQMPKDEQFIAGQRAAFSALFDRSNLPPEARTMPLQAVKLGIGTFDQLRIRKIPTGQTSAQLAAKEKKAGLPTATDRKLAGLSGLKLNLSSLKLKE